MNISDDRAHTYFLGICYSIIGSTLTEPLRFLFLVEKDFDIVDLGFVCVVVWFVIDSQFIAQFLNLLMKDSMFSKSTTCREEILGQFFWR